jgi:hypothetical protein
MLIYYIIKLSWLKLLVKRKQVIADPKINRKWGQLVFAGHRNFDKFVYP